MRNLLEEGLLLFNGGRFYEAHEVWEDLWRATLDPGLKTCYQGLIQAAVGLHHLSRRNQIGAGSQITKSMLNLRAGDCATTGLDLSGLIRQLEDVLREVSNGPNTPDRVPQPPRIARLK